MAFYFPALLSVTGGGFQFTLQSPRPYHNSYKSCVLPKSDGDVDTSEAGVHRYWVPYAEVLHLVPSFTFHQASS